MPESVMSCNCTQNETVAPISVHKLVFVIHATSDKSPRLTQPLLPPVDMP